jgi:crotonobetainyl-CoA:carnitine CoA-transferase CaiB-like acyl-CoA transferase
MDAPEMLKDPRFATRDARVANAHELEARITSWSRAHSVAEVVAKLEAVGVPVAPVRHPEEALIDKRVVARGETMPIAHPLYPSKVDLRTAGVPIRFSQARTGFDDVLPVRIGEHNERIYTELLSYDSERLADLRARGVL